MGAVVVLVVVVVMLSVGKPRWSDDCWGETSEAEELGSD
jgi:hypothetical protein